MDNIIPTTDKAFNLNNMGEIKYDSITNLFERNSFYNLTDNMLRQNHNEKFLMVSMDILNFRMVNELYGSEEGDLLLAYVGKLIKEYFQDDKKVTSGREQGDVFLVCLEYKYEEINNFMEYMKTELKNYRLSMPIHVYFGIYIIDNYIDSGRNIIFICESAKLALKSIKGNYMKSFAYFNDDMRNEYQKKMAIVKDMEKALENNEFEVYLQPKCNLVSKKCVGAEALVRWNHKEKGIISPMDFIPVFEDNGFICLLDRYMFEHVCIMIREWIDSGKDSIPISVNLSQVSLEDNRLCDTLIEMVEKYKVPVELLELEITETVYTKNKDNLRYLMERLQKYGFKISMDDFGSGYSSLSVLKDLEVDILKMDLKFLNNLTDSTKGSKIISMVVKMAKSLGIKVIAEGVETIEDVNFLKDINCIVGQGYYFSRPITVPKFKDQFLDRIEDDVFDVDKALDENKIAAKEENSEHHIDLDKYLDKTTDLKNESSLLIKILSECNVGIWEYDIRRKQIIQTPLAKRLYGWDKVIEDAPDSLVRSGNIHKDSVEEFLNMYDALHRGQKEASCIIQVKLLDGSWAWKKITYFMRFDEHGEPLMALGIADDVQILNGKTNKRVNREKIIDVFEDNKDINQEELFNIDENIIDVVDKKDYINYINNLIQNRDSFYLSYVYIENLESLDISARKYIYDECMKIVLNHIKHCKINKSKIFKIDKDEIIFIRMDSDTSIIDQKIELLNNKIKAEYKDYNVVINHGTISIAAYENLN